MTETVQNKELATNKAYDYLLLKMQKGEFLPGSSLNLKEIRAELGVSSTPLSNALIRLEAEGFVTVYQRSRVVVNKLEFCDFRLLYGVIGTIEHDLILESIESYDVSVIEKMYALNEKMKEALHSHRIKEYDQFHYSFHEIFLEQNNNLFARRIITPIKKRLWDFPRKNFVYDWYLQAVQEHEHIIRVIETRDTQSLARVIRDIHWGYEYQKNDLKVEYDLEE